VDEDTEMPYFARLPEIDLHRAIRCVKRSRKFDGESKDQELDEILESELHKPFAGQDRSLLFSRVAILRSSSSPADFVASFIYHHEIADGMSGIIFHDSFWSALNNNLPELSASIVYSSNKSLLPNIEMVHDTDVDNIRRPNIGMTALWSGKTIQAPVSGGKFRSLTFPKSTTGAFVQRCRSNDATVTAAIEVLLAVSLFRIIPSRYTLLRGSVAINARRFICDHITETSMGVFIDSVSESYDREDLVHFSWSDARESRSNILDYLDRSGMFLEVAKLKFVQGLKDRMVGLLDKKRETSFEISNLGRVGKQNEATGCGWRRGRMMFSQSASAMGSAIGCTVVTGADGCLVLGFTWQNGVVEDEVAEEVVQSLEREIIRLSG
jgi:hypothetical protein